MIGKIVAGEFLVFDNQIEVEYNDKIYTVDLKFNKKTMLNAWTILENYEKEVIASTSPDDIAVADKKMLKEMDKIVDVKFIKDTDTRVATIQNIFVAVSDELQKSVE